MKFFGKELKFNGYDVYHKGNKPTPADIEAAAVTHTHAISNVNGLQSALDARYTKTQTDSLITNATGTKVYVSSTQPSGTIASGSLWL